LRDCERCPASLPIRRGLKFNVSLEERESGHARSPFKAPDGSASIFARSLEEAAKYPFPRAEKTAFDEAMANHMLSDLKTVREEPGQLEDEQRGGRT